MSPRGRCIQKAWKMVNRNERINVWCAIKDSRLVYCPLPETGTRPLQGYVVATIEENGRVFVTTF